LATGGIENIILDDFVRALT